MTQTIQKNVTITDVLHRKRLDQALAELVPEYSRSRLQQWIKAGFVTLDGRVPVVRERVRAGQSVCITAELQDETAALPENIPLEIVFEDAALLVINKPAGLVVHPAAGNPAGTLLNALLHYDESLVQLPRAGIVHRLDKQTSGIMVVARTLTAHKNLVEALQARTVKREYQAVVNTVLTAGGTVDVPIGRHPVDRKRMAVVSGGREALTHYRVAERFRAHTLVDVQLETGRTHQIRVHMAHLRTPIIGDPVYGGRLRLPGGATDQLRTALQQFRRQALHARRLALPHPVSGEDMAWETALPDDMKNLIAVLRADAQQAG